MWQVKECENMKHEEYYDIKEMGWDAWQAKFIAEKCDNNWERLQPYFAALPKAYGRFYEAGIPCICDFLMITPFEYFCGGRSLEAFFMDDLMDEPELMHEISPGAVSGKRYLVLQRICTGRTDRTGTGHRKSTL